MEVYEYFLPPSVIENSTVQLIGANNDVLYNNISVNDKPHIRRWYHTIIIEQKISQQRSDTIVIVMSRATNYSRVCFDVVINKSTVLPGV